MMIWRLAVLGVVIETGEGSLANMNGEYKIANAHAFNTNFSSYPSLGHAQNYASYVDVYTKVETRYSEVFWAMSDEVPFPDEFMAQFGNSTIAIVGYEADQVQRTPQGDVPVPITWAYNHHYMGRVIGKYAELKLMKLDAHDPRNPHDAHMSAGDKVWVHENVGDPTPDSPIPTLQGFDEANGGEWRKSFHGYPHGYAQILEKPKGWRLEPMQIDTKNRDGSMEKPADGFHAGITPKNYRAPLGGPDAVYSGLLECPCTTRITRRVKSEYLLQTQGSCARKLQNATTCFRAAQTLGLPSNTMLNNVTVSNASLPSGCMISQGMTKFDAAISVIFNEANSVAPCGGTRQKPVRLRGSAASLVNISLDLDHGVPGGNVTVMAMGPADVWFGLAFGVQQMAGVKSANQGAAAIIMEASGSVFEQKLGYHVAGHTLDTQVKVLSNVVEKNIRRVILTRPFQGLTKEHYTFNLTESGLLSFITAVGSAPKLSFHKSQSSSSMLLTVIGVPNCVCSNKQPFGHADGDIVYTHDDDTEESISFNGGDSHASTRCPPSPRSDLLETKNPTCDVRTYQGGLLCCHHKWLLTDTEQAHLIPADVFEYYMKFRIWFQEYVPATVTSPASHQNLVRFYYTLGCGEYDVVRNAKGTQLNEAFWRVRDMLRTGSVRDSVYNTGIPTEKDIGIHLIYANGHCHASSCIYMELYNNDTGELLCRQDGHMGRTAHPETVRAANYDEAGYVTIAPCLWGPTSQGLHEPLFLSWETTLKSVKVANSTYGHTGEMAHWQMRGVLSNGRQADVLI